MVVRLLAACMILFLVSFRGSPAAADGAQVGSNQTAWTNEGVQLRCDAANRTFEVFIYVRPRDDEDVLQKGFKGIKEGTSLRGCKLGKRSVLAQIMVRAETRSDVCKRGGTVEIPSLSVDGVELEDQVGNLRWWCAGSDGPAIVHITVKTKSAGVTYALCTTMDRRDGTWEDRDCKTRSVDVAKQAAAFAKIDRDLADPATQAAQSVARLPASLDMAEVFATQKDSDGLPLCAHWIEFAWQGEVQPWARIGGKPSERTPIYPVYPPVCTRKSDRTCDSSAYVIAGDRVDISAVCGAWTAIRYRPRVRAFPDTRGWVKTSRLYDAQSLHEPPTPATQMRSQEKDPLNQAVDRRDAQAVTELLRNGAGPNGPDGSGKPLLFALANSDLPVVEALLAGGATPDPGAGGWNRVGMSALEMVAKTDRLQSYQSRGQKIDSIPLLQILLQHGAIIDAADTYGLTPLLRAIDAENVDVVAFLLGAGADPNKVRSVGGPDELGYTPLLAGVSGYGWDHDPAVIRFLLAHGANPDSRARPGAFNPLFLGYPGETSLTIAAREGYTNVVRDLLDHGANPALPRGDGALPADIARRSGFPEIAKLLDEAAQKKANAVE